MRSMDLTQEILVAQLQEVQTLFECTQYISKTFFFSHFLSSEINQTACHKYVKDSQAQCSQTMADGWRLTDRVTN